MSASQKDEVKRSGKFVRPRGRRLSHVVFDELRQRLFDGRYPADHRIPIEGLCAEFDISRQPVMDAMHRLESLGLVQIVPQSGCRVTRYSARETDDFFRMFAAFEGEIAAAAAQRRTEQQLAELDDAWERIRNVQATRDPQNRARAYRIRNRTLHLVIHAMADSRIMAESSERMWDMSDFLIATVGGTNCMAHAVHERNEDHDVIRRAIRARSADVARAAMESHIVGTLRLFENLPQVQGSAAD